MSSNTTKTPRRPARPERKLSANGHPPKKSGLEALREIMAQRSMPSPGHIAMWLQERLTDDNVSVGILLTHEGVNHEGVPSAVVTLTFGDNFEYDLEITECHRPCDND
jgi:hypothetical protein